MPKRAGRPRGFDRDSALREAMEVFWALGYEGARLEILQKAMGGISAPSLYAAFGSKEALFREAVELYARTVGAPVAAALDGGATARDSIDGMLRAVVNLVCSDKAHRGCLVTLGTVNCSQGNQKVQEHVRALRAGFSRRVAGRLRKAVLDGELPANADTAAAAGFYLTVIDGLVLQAKEGATRKFLQTTADCAMAAWDGLMVRKQGSRSAHGAGDGSGSSSTKDHEINS